ncbi:MAG: class II 3-deoxy-7-phosphoheptulonate synthase [Alphaproteobacteria bacterium]
MKNINLNNWSKSSWRNFPAKQQPNYDDSKQLSHTLNQLNSLPPLVLFDEIEGLKKELALVSKGEAFLLQGGDCAESFAEFSRENLELYFNLILQMTIVLMYGLKKPVVKIGRIAGQFAKPRSQDFEEKDGKTMPAYRGDIINNIDFESDGRRPNPENLVKAYFQSASALNFLRSMAKGGSASLENVNRLNENFIKDASFKKKFAEVVENINNSLKFINSCGLDTNSVEEFKSASFYISHEGLLLPYEEAFVLRDDKTGKNYACSAHFLWIGERTRSLDEAHIEFFRGISNPIGCKVGASMKEDELLKLIDALNPANEHGRLTLISRMGAGKVEENLSRLVARVKKEVKNVIWSCDPMHGNTIKSASGYKTRPFDDILSEIKSFFNVHKQLGTHAGGIHLELTGKDVTECVGGTQNITDLDLQNRYHTHCDPRLNATQSLELAFLIGDKF